MSFLRNLFKNRSRNKTRNDDAFYDRTLEINDWRSFLEDFSVEMLQASEIRSKVPEEVLRTGWMGYPGATEEQIQHHESRLGINLPSSYREFLKVSNGWRQVGFFIEALHPIENVEWFKVRNPEWVQIWTENIYSVTDKEYFVYGKGQNSVTLRAEYLASTLEISVAYETVYLLNPKIKQENGEWEAWDFGDWPGAYRYRTFAELMSSERNQFRWLLKNPR